MTEAKSGNQKRWLALVHLLAELGDTEQAVVQIVVERLRERQRQSGPLELAADRNDAGRLEAITDAVVAVAGALMRGQPYPLPPDPPILARGVVKSVRRRRGR